MSIHVPWRESVIALPYGKRLPDAKYILFEPGVVKGERLPRKLDLLVRYHYATHAWKYFQAVDNNVRLQVVVKFWLNKRRISFLDYPHFSRDPHPELRFAVQVTIPVTCPVTCKTQRYGSANPPILHRKELFVPPGFDPELKEKFRLLTQQEEQFGLYRGNVILRIGHKQYWENLLARRNLYYQGHKLVKRQNTNQ